MLICGVGNCDFGSQSEGFVYDIVYNTYIISHIYIYILYICMNMYFSILLRKMHISMYIVRYNIG